MKITLITTNPDLIENDRIREEVLLLGHKFQLIDIADFNFFIKDGKLNVPQIENLETDIVIVRGIFNSIKSISVVLDSLRKGGIKIFDNNLFSHLYSIDKVTDMMKLTLAGIPIPETYYSRDFSDFEKSAEKLGFPLVLKYARMGKGAGIFKMDSSEELKTKISELQNDEKDAKSFLVQQFIPYVHDLRTLIIGKSVFVMKRIPQKGEFRANFSLGGSVEPFDLDEEGHKLAIKALAAIDMSVGGVDVLIDKDNNRYILEVNHTAGFVGMEDALKQNIGKVFVEHAIESAK